MCTSIHRTKHCALSQIWLLLIWMYRIKHNTSEGYSRAEHTHRIWTAQLIAKRGAAVSRHESKSELYKDEVFMNQINSNKLHVQLMQCSAMWWRGALSHVHVKMDIKLLFRIFKPLSLKKRSYICFISEKNRNTL